MVKIYLVRHGEATEGWTSQDPPLSELGKSQAQSLITFVDSAIDKNSSEQWKQAIIKMDIEMVSFSLTCQKIF